MNAPSVAIAHPGIVLLLGALALPVNAAPKSELWERWAAHEPTATNTIDHSAWDSLLARNVRSSADGINRVGYAKISREDRLALDDYLSTLQRVNISNQSRDEQLAYWINLYNALTLRVVLDHYPVASIRDISISPGFFSIGPWKKKLIVVEEQNVSLDDIEHRILRPIWKDARIHYAVNCAALGCPNLMQNAYTASNAERLLEQGARDYVNHERGVQFVGGDRLVVSSIYEWFREDFGGNDDGVIAHLRQYANADLAAKLANASRIRAHAYEWSLNDTESTGKPRTRRFGSGTR